LRHWLICRNKAAMQILRCFLALCVAAFGLAALSLRADDNPPPTLPPSSTSPETTLIKAESGKQAEANTRANKEAEKKAKAEAKAKKKADDKARKEAKAKAEPKKQAEAQTQKEAETKAKAQQGMSEKSATKAQAEKKPAAFKPIERPPAPISADKDQRLTELLRKYKADEITPDQYQKERAKILAEP